MKTQEAIGETTMLAFPILIAVIFGFNLVPVELYAAIICAPCIYSQMAYLQSFLVVQKSYTKEIQDINWKQNPAETITRRKKKKVETACLESLKLQCCPVSHNLDQ